VLTARAEHGLNSGPFLVRRIVATGAVKGSSDEPKIAEPLRLTGREQPPAEEVLEKFRDVFFMTLASHKGDQRYPHMW
jgi:hypothetical protein